jgi:hypothetical protein
VSDTVKNQASFVDGLVTMLDSLTAVADAAKGYHTHLSLAGFSSAAADAMTVELHSHILSLIFKAQASA